MGISNFISFQNLKQQKTRRDQFSQGPLSSSLPPSALSGHHHGSVLLAEEQVSIDMEEGSPLLPPTQKQAMIYDETVCTLSHSFGNISNGRQLIVIMVLGQLSSKPSRNHAKHWINHCRIRRNFHTASYNGERTRRNGGKVIFVTLVFVSCFLLKI